MKVGALSLAVIALGLPVRGATIHVPWDRGTIQEAIDVAAAGDTIRVASGVHLLDAPLSFKGKALRVVSDRGPLETILRMSPSPLDPDRTSLAVFRNGETSDTILEGFTLEKGKGTLDGGVRYGGAIYCATGASPTIARCVLRGNCATHGGAVAALPGGMEGPAPTFLQCTISGNNGGAFHGSATFIECLIVNNAGFAAGAFLEGGSFIELRHCTVVGNTGIQGGVIYRNPYSRVRWKLRSCIVWGNGGTVDLRSADMISHSCVEGPEPPPGPGNINADPLFCGAGPASEIHVDSSALGPGDGTPASPYPSLQAALAHEAALSTTSPCVGAGEDGTNMGAPTGTCAEPGARPVLVKVAPGRYDLTGVGFAQHVSLQGAGADATTLEGTAHGLRTGSTLSRVTVTNGTLGGVAVGPGESPEIRDCTIEGSEGLCGGGICSYEGGDLLVSGCRILGNRAERGGGIFCRGTLALTNCVVAGNYGDEGGGVNAGGAALRILNCTITDNHGWKGGGLFLVSLQASIASTVVWGNRATERPEIAIDAGQTTVSYSCVEGGFEGEGNLSADPQFKSLGVWEDVNGTPDVPDDDVFVPGDYRPVPGSPLIDAGTAEGAPGEDIDGRSRPRGGGWDIGAFEPTGEPAFVRADANSDAREDVSDAIWILSWLFRGGPESPCPDTADVNDDGSIDISDPLLILDYAFSARGRPAAPFPGCGDDLTEDDLHCPEFPACP